MDVRGSLPLAALRSLLASGRLSGLLLTGLLLLPGALRADPALTPPGGVSRSTVAPTELPTATRVVVHKSARRLVLLRGNEVLGTYRIALGLVPTGHKEKAGDFRTPEGRYQLSRRNARSDYFLSIQVSYPGPNDMKHARARGWDPGGSIMIHGLPNRLKRDPDYYAANDWTDGCIAVSNSDMVEIWLLTHDDTPIEILP
jgi:murein L,D-transpeptidase YafK